jgi:hypothetical protein
MTVFEITNIIYEDAQNKSKAEGSYFTGSIGALLGTLFGLALWLGRFILSVIMS